VTEQQTDMINATSELETQIKETLIAELPIDGLHVPTSIILESRSSTLVEQVRTLRDLRELEQQLEASSKVLPKEELALMRCLVRVFSLQELPMRIRELGSIQQIRHQPLALDELDKDQTRLISRLNSLGRFPKTVGDLFEINEFEFACDRGVGKKYISCLKQWKHNLLQCTRSLGSVRFEERELPRRSKSLGSNQVDWLIRESALPEHLQKTLRKLRTRSLAISGKVADIVDLNIENLKNLSSFGTKYLAQTSELRNLLGDPQYTYDPKVIEVAANKPLSSENLSRKAMRAWTSMQQQGMQLETVGDLFALRFDMLQTIVGFESEYLRAVVQSMREESYKRLESYEIQDNKIIISCAGIERELLAFLNELEVMREARRDALLFRFGIFCEMLNLKEIGDRLEVSESRVSQIISTQVKKWRKRLAYPVETYQIYFECRGEVDLAKEMPTLYGYFHDRGFFSFLEHLFALRKAHLYRHLRIEIPDVARRINSFFAEHPMPLRRECFLKLICEQHGYSRPKATNLLDRALVDGLLVMEEDQIISARLEPMQAVAQVYSRVAKPMHWAQALRITNALKLTERPLPLPGSLPGAHERGSSRVRRNPYLVPSARGLYVHRRYSRLQEQQNADLQEILLKLTETMPKEVRPLRSIFIELELTEYYTYGEFRRFVAQYFADHFDGQSRRDLFYKSGRAERVPKREVVFQFIKSSPAALTLRELRDEGLGHPQYLHVILRELMQEGRVIRQGVKQYTTPEKLLRSVPVAEVMQYIERVLNEEGRIIHDDWFAEQAPSDTLRCLTRWVYRALATRVCKQRGFHHTRSLYARGPLPYANLTEIMSQVLEPDMSWQQFSAALEERVALSNAKKINDVKTFWREHSGTEAHPPQSTTVGQAEALGGKCLPI